jgi:hypothetical protein
LWRTDAAGHTDRETREHQTVAEIIALLVLPARFIEFYVPDSFRKKVKWTSSPVRGEGKYHEFLIELDRRDAAFRYAIGGVIFVELAPI